MLEIIAKPASYNHSDGTRVRESNLINVEGPKVLRALISFRNKPAQTT